MGAWSPTVVPRNAVGPALRERRRAFLDRLDPDVVEILLEEGDTRAFSDDEVVAAQGAASESIGVVLDGVVKVSTTDDRGRKALLEIRGPGDVIGLLECCGAPVRSSTATSVGRSVLRVFSSVDLRAVLEAYPRAGTAAAEVLAERVAASIESRLRAGRSVSSRLAHCLLALARDHGHERGDGAVVVALPLSQDELAAFVDASRDAVAKTLMRWRRIGIIETGRCATVILDVDRLAASAGD